MKDSGPAWMSMGSGTGQNRAVDAAKQALASPLLDASAGGAKGVLFNIVGDSSLTLFEVNEAAEVIKQAVDPEANIIFGVAHDPNMESEIKITLIATGFIAKDNLAMIGKDDEMAEFLTNLKTREDELDVPSFLRRPLFSHRRHISTPPVRPEKAASN
jgi:cell division protein FtsZ